MTTTQYVNAHSYFDERKAKYAYKKLRSDRRFFLKHHFFCTEVFDGFWRIYG